MAGVRAGLRGLCALVALLLVAGSSQRAAAVEAFDGRVQLHGFYEMQVRALNRDFEEELDLAQWYNVINLELEFDILPDGWGPFDLLQAYVRAEGRYDCIYTAGCGIFPSVRTYGDDSRNLPLRLRDALDDDYGGSIDTNAQATPPGRVPLVRADRRDPTLWWSGEDVLTPESNAITDSRTYNPNLGGNCPTTSNTLVGDNQPSNVDPGCIDNRRTKFEIREREAFPGFDTLFKTLGADGELGDNPDRSQLGEDFYNPDAPVPPPVPGRPSTDTWVVYAPVFRGLGRLRDDPAFYTIEPVTDWRWTFRDKTGPRGSAGETLLMGPWLPENFFESHAKLADRANPLRSRNTPVQLYRNALDGAMRFGDIRYHELDCENGFGPASDPGCAGFEEDPIDARLRKLEEIGASLDDSGLGLEIIANSGIFLELDDYPNNDLFKTDPGSLETYLFFGGDFSGVLPCWEPRIGIPRPGGSNLQTNFITQISGTDSRQGCIPFTNIRVQGGEGETPMRVAPDRSNLATLIPGVAQGLYVPSLGLTRALATRDFDDHEFNISEIDRSFNRGASQRQTYELKEAYIDLELLDSRLWIRAGIQNIVWGKTELFRTTDQFNPQDFALASLPSLEESRIALLSARAVYSLYDVGPLEDVRLEIAANFDRIQPADLGGCGEPYTIDIICSLTAGFGLHGLTGIGIAGVNRPPNGWDDIDGVEFGGRIEFRWDRFSFAIVDYYGYNDFPFPDPIFFYERNVDPSTGMPRKAGATGSCANRAGFIVSDPWFGTDNPVFTKVFHGGNQQLEFESGLTDPDELAAVAPTGERDITELSDFFVQLVGANDDWHRTREAYSHLGIGIDDDCLKPGGVPGGPNENRFDPELAKKIPDVIDDLSKYSNFATDAPDPDTYVASTQGQWALEGSSVDYALAYHPANQQLFAVICSGTVSIAAALSPSSCAWNIFGSGAKLIGGGLGAPFSESLSAVFAGEIDRQITGQGGFLFGVVNNTKGQFTRIYPLAPLNSDVRDGRTTAGHGQMNFRGVNGFQRLFKDSARDQFDFLTMDNTLTWQQKALLGCGPAYGTRCDSGAPVVAVKIVDCTSGGQADRGCLPAAERPPGCSVGDPSCDPNHPNNPVTFIGQIDVEEEFRAREANRRYRIIYADGTKYEAGDTDIPFGRQVGDPRECLRGQDIRPCRVWGAGGGIDYLNAEGSVIVQSMPGFEGTDKPRTSHRESNWQTWWADETQPGTIGLVGRIGHPDFPDRAPVPFVGSEYCTRYAPDNPTANELGIVRLPGCRGAVSATVNVPLRSVDVVFDEHYDPKVDGCVFGRQIQHADLGVFYVRPVYGPDHPNAGETNTELREEFDATCFNGFGNPNVAGNPNLPDDPDVPNPHRLDPTWFSYSRRQQSQSQAYQGSTVPLLFGSLPGEIGGARTLYHPFAQCEQTSSADTWFARQEQPDGSLTDPECRFWNRDFATDLIDGHAQVFRNELAALSFNLGIFLVLTSCNNQSGTDDLQNERDCFLPERPWATGRCSFGAMHFCRNLKGFLSVAGLGRNDVRAGGNPNVGRRTFIWHSGGELILEYARRNVFGLSADFAEDRTKTNWGVEFTWIGNVPFLDNNSMTQITDSQALNLTVSVDRPTFINFLNANRTFFMNSQWFFQYLTNYNKGFGASGPFNVLFTFAVFTGYYQDRLLPQFVSVYDFRSQSGGFLPQLTYRFNEAFSVTFGVSWFIGRGEFVPMPVRGFAPTGNRAGPHTYEDGTERLLSLIRHRDEAFMRVRWTF